MACLFHFGPGFFWGVKEENLWRMDSGEDTNNSMSSMSELIWGMVILIIGYSVINFAHSPVSQLVGKAVGHTAHAVAWFASSPFGIPAAILTGLVAMAITNYSPVRFMKSLRWAKNNQLDQVGRGELFGVEARRAIRDGKSIRALEEIRDTLQDTVADLQDLQDRAAREAAARTNTGAGEPLQQERQAARSEEAARKTRAGGLEEAARRAKGGGRKGVMNVLERIRV